MHKLKERAHDIMSMVPSNVAIDVAEDITQDVLTEILERGMEGTLGEIVERCTEENIQLYVKCANTRPITELPFDEEGQNAATRFFDEAPYGEVFFDRDKAYYVEID